MKLKALAIGSKVLIWYSGVVTGLASGFAGH